MVIGNKSASRVGRSLKMSENPQAQAKSSAGDRAKSSVDNARRLAGLVNTFITAVGDFNNRDWDHLKTLLDDPVIAHTVHGQHPVQPHTPDGVVNYLKADVAKSGATFVLLDFPQAIGSTVTGTACWTDVPAVEVTYTFIFSQGLIKQMSAFEDGNLC
jgi:hypothetical protein